MSQQRRSVIGNQHRPEFGEAVQVGIIATARVGMRVVLWEICGSPSGFRAEFYPRWGY